MTVTDDGQAVRKIRKGLDDEVRALVADETSHVEEVLALPAAARCEEVRVDGRMDDQGVPSVEVPDLAGYVRRVRNELRDPLRGLPVPASEPRHARPDERT